jgi:uncharacterized protein (TIGR02145 family)
MIINQILENHAANTGIVTYQIHAGAGNCISDTVEIPITVFSGDSVRIVINSSAANVCSGTSVSLTATPANPGTSPVYQWKLNGANAGTNSATFSFTPQNGDKVSCVLTSSDTVCVSNNPATSDTITMIVNPLLPVSVSVSASATQVCAGSPVTFTATPANGGSAPLYQQWKVNGSNAGTNNPVFSFVPANSDVVNCILTSSDTTCTTNNPDTSAAIRMTVNPTLPVSVSVTASSNPFCTGNPVSFTVSGINGGLLPAYQWKLNGQNAGVNTATFACSPLAGDTIWCVMTSTLNCVSINPAISNKIMMRPAPKPSVRFTACKDVITTLNAKPFKLKGGTPLGGLYSGPGVNASTSILTPSAAGTGAKTIRYTFTNAYTCTDFKTITITVLPASSFSCGSILTDVRDGKHYKTFSLPNGRCWMLENLDFGSAISDRVPMTENCIAEKYAAPPVPPVPTSNFDCSIVRVFNSLNLKSEMRNLKSETGYQSFYQWDELMGYDPASAGQGLCPPGWHVPTTSEWEELLSFFNGAGQAGGALKDTTNINGFRSFEQGLFYQNHTWAFGSGLWAGAMYWSSTLLGGKPVARGLNRPNPSVSFYVSARGNAFGVRCMKDN